MAQRAIDLFLNNQIMEAVRTLEPKYEKLMCSSKIVNGIGVCSVTAILTAKVAVAKKKFAELLIVAKLNFIKV